MLLVWSQTTFCRCHDWLLNNLMTHQNVDLMKELGYVCAELSVCHCFR